MARVSSYGEKHTPKKAPKIEPVHQMFHIYPKDFFSFEECRFHMPTIRKDIICR